ncbi:hypothetical protein [Thalassococcus sp. S3]|uniref:hypothetical protein n=1 Tax=Thalassococcus sp. S3 TaxID=2017482 RepID=UPI0010245922|nr:hypothetical protein [Thalassococcus sp. S3]QBF33627.1 hypothetical protein CFI11_20765 [Thalassococcus sp. S3]
MRWLILTFFLLTAPASQAQQQGWGDLDTLLLQTLSPTGDMVSSFWMPDHQDPAAARHALAIIYSHIPGSAGNVSIHSGLFERTSSGWSLRQQVTGLFGQSPSDPKHLPDRIEVTTATLGPNDPRCCPTQSTRWWIDPRTGAAHPSN